MSLKEKIESFYVNPRDINTKCHSNVKGSTYGQLNFQGAEAFIEEFSNYLDKPDAVFYDLGCGPGHLVFHIGLMTKVKKAIGIEFEAKRLEYAIKAVEEHPDIDNVEFFYGDFTDKDLSDATIVYIDNTVLPDTIVDKVYDKLPTGCLLVTAKNYKNMCFKTKLSIHRNYSNSKIHYLTKE
jgi:SAM-dependent methyltransferase